MEMVMKFPNGETPNLLIEVFNYNPACALQIRYTSGFGRSRRGWESVTDTCVRKHGRQETFCMLRPSSLCPSSALMEANCRPGKWEWSRHRWSGDGREGGTQVIKRLSSDCYLSRSWLLQSTCQRVLQLDIELQIASNTMSSVWLGVNGRYFQGKRGANSLSRCVSADFRTLVPSMWKGAKPSHEVTWWTSGPGHLFAYLSLKQLDVVSYSLSWSFSCLMISGIF